MARRYVRDNRGRFASVGATGRGGRLKTAGGNRRATQTRQIRTKPAQRVIRAKDLSPEANYRIIRSQKGRFGTVGKAAKEMAKRGGIKSRGDIEALAAIAKRSKPRPVVNRHRPVSPSRRLIAPKRLQYEVQYHGTNKQAARSIREGGFKESRSGVWGGGVYSSSRKATARAYTPKGDEIILRMMVPKSKARTFPVEHPGSETKLRGRNRALGVTRIMDPLRRGGGTPAKPIKPKKGDGESWLISPASEASRWLDRRQVIPVPSGARRRSRQRKPRS